MMSTKTMFLHIPSVEVIVIRAQTMVILITQQGDSANQMHRIAAAIHSTGKKTRNTKCPLALIGW